MYLAAGEEGRRGEWQTRREVTAGHEQIELIGEKWEKEKEKKRTRVGQRTGAHWGV
jgi:hypothetical protein